MLQAVRGWGGDLSTVSHVAEFLGTGPGPALFLQMSARPRSQCPQTCNEVGLRPKKTQPLNGCGMLQRPSAVDEICRRWFGYMQAAYLCMYRSRWRFVDQGSLVRLSVQPQGSSRRAGGPLPISVTGFALQIGPELFSAARPRELRAATPRLATCVWPALRGPTSPSSPNAAGGRALSGLLTKMWIRWGCRDTVVRAGQEKAGMAALHSQAFSRRLSLCDEAGGRS